MLVLVRSAFASSLLLSCLLVCGSACPALANTLPAAGEPLPAGRLQTSERTAPPDSGPVRPLLLEEVLRQVEAYYPKLIGADAKRRAASAKRLEKQGAFDPAFVIGANALDYNSSGSLKSAVTNEFAVEFLTPFGLKFAAGGRLNTGAVKSPDSSTGTGGEYFFSIKLPLLRNAGMNEKLAAERQARLGEPLANQDFAEKRLDNLLKAGYSYWDWVAAKRRLTVAQELLQIAQVRATAFRKRAEEGDVPKIVAVDAEREVQLREGNLAKARRDLQKEAFKLGLYLWRPDGTPAPLPAEASAPESAPSERPAELTPAQTQLGKELALERRPELKSLLVQREISRVDLALARNQRLPAVDIVYNPGLDTGIRSVGNTLKAGILLSVPLRTRGPDGQSSAAELRIRELEQEFALTRQAILNQVDDAVSQITQTYRRFLAAEQELELARRVEEGERNRLALGDTDLLTVNLRERERAQAAVKVIDIQAEFQQALLALRALTVQL